MQNPAVRSSTLRGYEDVGLFAQAYRGNFTANTFVAGTSQTHLGTTPTWPTGNAEDIEMNRVFVDLGYVLQHCEDYKTDVHFTYNYLGHRWELPAPLVAQSHSYLLEATHYRPLTEKLDLIFGGFTDFHEGESFTVPPFERFGTASMRSWNCKPPIG